MFPSPKSPKAETNPTSRPSFRLGRQAKLNSWTLQLPLFAFFSTKECTPECWGNTPLKKQKKEITPQGWGNAPFLKYFEGSRLLFKRSIAFRRNGNSVSLQRKRTIGWVLEEYPFQAAMMNGNKKLFPKRSLHTFWMWSPGQPPRKFPRNGPFPRNKTSQKDLRMAQRPSGTPPADARRPPRFAPPTPPLPRQAAGPGDPRA